MDDFAKAARSARRRRGLTQKAVAREAGLGQSTVAAIENGYDSSGQARAAIAEVLGFEAGVSA